MAGHENDENIADILEKMVTLHESTAHMLNQLAETIREHVHSQGEPEQSAEWKQFVAAHPELDDRLDFTDDEFVAAVATMIREWDEWAVKMKWKKSYGYASSREVAQVLLSGSFHRPVPKDLRPTKGEVLRVAHRLGLLAERGRIGRLPVTSSYRSTRWTLR